MRLDSVRPLYADAGGYASLYLDSSRTAEDGALLRCPVPSARSPGAFIAPPCVR
jgi:hypothetical protein